MSLRKTVGLLAGFALAVGLIGGGVSAAFTDQVAAVQHINVGTFQCKIVAAAPVGSATIIATDGKSVTYTAPTIMSSAAGSAPFSFTVQNTGTIADVLTVSQTGVASPFSSILAAPVTPVTLTVGGTKVYDAGLKWTELGTANLGQAVSITYTVNCNEDLSTVAFSSDNALDGNGYVPTHENGTGFAAGPVTVSFSYAWGTKGYVYNNVVTADAAGNFSWSGEENCFDAEGSGGVLVRTDQTVIVKATDGGHSAIGTGILHCSLYATTP